MGWVGVAVAIALSIGITRQWQGYTLLGIADTHQLAVQYQEYLASLERQHLERPTLSPATLLAQIEAGEVPIILDVRTTAEYEAGHIPGAIHIDYRELPERLNELPADKATRIITYCRTGVRAGVAEQTLRTAGFTHVLHLEGDMTRWVAQNFPVQR
jgi:rhodanese-related sulfurtransferase